MKNILLIKFLIILLLSINPVYASKAPNIPKGIDKTTYCDKKGGSFGHVIVVIDLTTKLDEARIEFIKYQVFSKEFYMNYDPFTKFSYFLVNHNEPTKQKFLFSKCRPKTGDGNLSKLEKATLFENSKVLNNYSSRFFNEANNQHNDIFSVKKDSKYSYIYETIAYIFQNPKSDFKSKHRRRDLIIVSDMMQNSDRLSFYKACNAKSNKAKCPKFSSFMNNLSDKDYMTATAPKGNNINLKMIYLNNRYETNKEIDRSLKELWVEYFKSRNFKKIEVVSQLDIN